MKDLKDSWTTVGWETVVDRDPDVIVINNYGDTSAARKKAFLKSYAAARRRLGGQARPDLRHGLRRPRRKPPQPRRRQRPGPLSARCTEAAAEAGDATHTRRPPFYTGCVVTTDWKSDLRQRGYRLTPQRQLVLEAVDSLEHATPDDILTEVRKTASAA